MSIEAYLLRKKCEKLIDELRIHRPDVSEHERDLLSIPSKDSQQYEEDLRIKAEESWKNFR